MLRMIISAFDYARRGSRSSACAPLPGIPLVAHTETVRPLESRPVTPDAFVASAVRV
jgi:hypothetical protein